MTAGAAGVRNVVLVGPAGSGKTTLLQALLVRSGARPRGGRAEGVALDPDGRGRGTALTAAALRHHGATLNLLDAPGDPDFAGHLQAGLRAGDAALFVVAAGAGLDARTAQLWEECADAGMPRAVVVSRLDRPDADFDEAVALCQRLLGEDVLPLHVPMHGDDGGVAGLIDLLRLRVSDWSTGVAVRRDPDPEHVRLVEGLRSDLLEAVLAESGDASLLDRYLAGDPLDPGALAGEFEAAVARGHVHPVLAVSPLQGAGTEELLDLLVAAFPSPLERACPPVTRPDGGPVDPLACDPAGPLAAEVVRTWTDPERGRRSLVRVLSGTLRRGTAVLARGHREQHAVDEPLGALSPVGADPQAVAECSAGDLCVVTGLGRAATGDTLSRPEDPLLAAPWELPEPQLPVALAASSTADEERLTVALEQLVAEEPGTRVERHAETGQLLLWCAGPVQAEVLLDRLRGRHGVPVDTPEVVVALRGAGTTAGGRVLEPWVELAVDVPAAFAGPVRRDLAARRAQLLDTEAALEHPDRVTVRAQVPEAELLTYAAGLRAVSHGTGRARRRPLDHRPAPS